MYATHCGNNVDFLTHLKSDIIQLTVTSPPYDNLRKYNGYSFPFEELAKQLFRVTKPGGIVVWVVNDATVNGSETCTSFKQAIYFKEVCGFNLHDTMIYASEKPPQTSNRYDPKFEYMFVFSKGKPTIFNPLREPCTYAGQVPWASRKYRQVDGSLKQDWAKGAPTKETKYRGNIWKYNTGFNKSTQDREAFKHPAIFPEQLAADHISSWSNDGDLVLDPFLGSGTTGKMALASNRNFVGCDISQEYFELATTRMMKMGGYKPMFELIVGNVGLIRCDDETQAKQLFKDYTNDSCGRSAGESVALLKNGVIVEEEVERCLSHKVENCKRCNP